MASPLGGWHQGVVLLESLAAIIPTREICFISVVRNIFLRRSIGSINFVIHALSRGSPMLHRTRSFRGLKTHHQLNLLLSRSNTNKPAMVSFFHMPMLSMSISLSCPSIMVAAWHKTYKIANIISAYKRLSSDHQEVPLKMS